MKPSEIKPCPFCGERPIVKPANPERDGGAWGAVECIAKRCPANPIVFDGEEVADERGSDAYKEAAIRRWNTRAIQLAEQQEEGL